MTQLTPLEYQGVQKLGDFMIPGTDRLPKFSKTGCAEHIDRILNFMPALDLKDLKMFLSILGRSPNALIVMIWPFFRLMSLFPHPLGTPFRKLLLGTKGLIMSLYYSGSTSASYTGKKPLDCLGYSVKVFTEDLRS